jgi:hypothetical protein
MEQQILFHIETDIRDTLKNPVFISASLVQNPCTLQDNDLKTISGYNLLPFRDSFCIIRFLPTSAFCRSGGICRLFSGRRIFCAVFCSPHPGDSQGNAAGADDLLLFLLLLTFLCFSWEQYTTVIR